MLIGASSIVSFECLALYLQKGLPTRDDTSDNFKRSQLVAGFACDDAEALCDFYLEYLNKLADSGEEVFTHAYRDVKQAFPNLPPNCMTSASIANCVM